MMAIPVSMGECCHCGEPMWATRTTVDTYLRNSQGFYCIHGHKQHYPQGKSEAEKLREQLDAQRRRAERAEQNVAYERDRATRERNRANGYKGHATRMTKRAKAGVCPCCNRTFAQLARHMATQHPEFTPIEVHEGEPT